MEGTGPRLMGPSPRRDFALLHFLPLIFSPVFFTGRICNEGKEQNRNKQKKKKGLEDLGMNKIMLGGEQHTAQDGELLRVPQQCEHGSE